MLESREEMRICHNYICVQLRKYFDLEEAFLSKKSTILSFTNPNNVKHCICQNPYGNYMVETKQTSHSTLNLHRHSRQTWLKIRKYFMKQSINGPSRGILKGYLQNTFIRQI